MHTRKQHIVIYNMLLCFILFITGCALKHESLVQQPTPTNRTQSMLLPDMPTTQQHMTLLNPPSMPLGAAPMTRETSVLPQNATKLDFEVENQTGKTIYITCFSYIKRRAFTRWRWDKSEIYQLNPGQSTLIDIDYIEDPRDRQNVYGYLALFDTHAAAEAAIYELLPDNLQIDLDQIIKLKGKKVVVEIEKYGAKGELYEYDFVKKKIEKRHITKRVDTLDFPVENKTGKPMYVVCFTYQKKAKGTWIGMEGEKDDMSLWHYTKEPLLYLMPNETAMIEVAHVEEGRDQIYVQGFLGIFEENEEKLAQDATYERLSHKRKLALGRLIQLEGKKVVLEVEKYGVTNDFIDYRIKPTRSIDFTKVKGPREVLLKETKHYGTDNTDTTNLPA